MLYNAKTGKEIKALQGHVGSVLSVAFSPDGKTVASGSGDETVKLWSASGETAKKLPELSEKPMVAQYSYDGSQIVVYYRTQSVAYDSQTLRELSRSILDTVTQETEEKEEIVAFSRNGNAEAKVSGNEIKVVSGFIPLWTVASSDRMGL